MYAKDIPRHTLCLDVWFAIRPMSHDLVHIEVLDSNNNSLWKGVLYYSELPEVMHTQHCARTAHLLNLSHSGGQVQ
jgi:hypothetical protein